MASSASSELGTLVRISPLEVKDLPMHHSWEATGAENSQTLFDAEINAGRPKLVQFIKQVLLEGGNFISAIDDESVGKENAATKQADSLISKKSSSVKNVTSNGVKIPVHQYSATVEPKVIKGLYEAGSIAPSRGDLSHAPLQAIPEEYWFGRRSEHDAVASPGYATFAEFTAAMRDNHSEQEADYTPDVYDCKHVLSWKQEIEELIGSGELAEYSNVSMDIYEMCHKLPSPFSPRNFSTLVVTGTVKQSENHQDDPFVVVQIPVSIAELPTSFYSSNRNTREGTGFKSKNTVNGVYTSVEKFTLVKEPSKDGSDGAQKAKVVWQMATASDAKGRIPVFVQKPNIPGAILKDVELVLNYIAKQRQAAGGETAGGN